jgi:hypothetical protein
LRRGCHFGLIHLKLLDDNLLYLFSLLCAIMAACSPAQDRSYGRSVVSTQYGIVATSWVQASQAGARILEQGGSAIDAAIAANAVLNVSEPMTNGMGGDLFAIYWDAKTGKLYGLNASGWAPEGADHRASEVEGHHLHAAIRHRFRHRPRHGRWLDKAARPLWQAALACSLSARYFLC